jgi:hypothetical protein
MSVCAFLLAVLSVGALAQPNETFYVDSEWVVPVNTTSDGSIQRPFLNLSAVADAISDWAMQGIDMAVVSVHLAPRLYSGPANCFQVLNLLVMAEFELDGAWTNGNGSSNSTGTPLATATFECVNTAPKNAQQLVWLGLFGARDRFAMSNVTFRNSHAICSDMWLTYDVSLDEPPMKMLCETYQGKPRVVCGGVVLSTAQHHAGTAVIFRGVHFHHNVVNVTNPGPGMATALTNAVRKSHSPLVILARGVVHSCDSVTIANSTFVNNTLEVVEFPTSDSQAMWGLFRTYSAVGGGALSVSGGQFELANCTFVDNVAQFSLLESLTVNVIGHGFTDIVAGGAVLIDMGSDLAVMNSTFVNNVAIGFRSAGGAIALCWPDEKAITHDQRHSSIFALVRGSVFTNNSVSDGSKLGYWADLPSELDITAARIVYEGAGGAIAFGLVSPNSTRSFVPVPTALRDCTFDSNSVVVEALMSTEKMPCFGGAVMSSVLTVIDVVFNDNVVDCVDASGGAIETILIVVENTTFARNAARSTWADRSTGGSISNRVLPTIDSSTCARMTWSLTNCSFVGNASVGANDAAHIRGAAIWIDPQCTPNVGDFTDLSFVGFRAATIVDATGLRLYPRMFTIQDCSGSFVFRTTDESAASSAYTAKFVIWNSSARFGPLVTVNSIDVRLNVIAANVSMLADPIVHLTALHAVVVPFIDDCECISSFECDSTALHIQSQLGNSSVLIADGFFRRVRGKAIVRVVQKDFADSTTLRVSGLQFVDCEVGSVLAIEKREATAVLSEQFFLVIDSVFLNNTIATSILRWMSLGVPQRIAIGIEMSQIAFQNVTVVGNRAFASDDVVAIELVVVDRFAREVDGARSNAAVHLIDCVFRDNVGLAVARGADLYIEGLLFVNNSVSGSVFAWLHGWAVIQASNATFIQNRGALVHAEAVDGTIDQLPSVIGFMGLNVLDHIVDRPLIWVSLPQANVSVALVETAFDNINSEDSLVAALYVTNVVVSRTVFHRVLVNARTPTCGGALFIGRADAVALSSAVFVNTSAAFGGAICLGRTTTFAAANVTFANNSAHVGPDIYYVSPDVAHAIDVNLKAASVASAVSLSGFERGVMPGVPVDLTFAARDVFGRMPPANQQHAISMVRYAVELTTVNCTHDLNDVSFLCIINEYDHECVARVVFRGAPDTDCALNFMLRPIDAVLPRALAVSAARRR